MSEQARTWILRLLALAIAIGIWFNASVEDRLVPSERVVEASVSFNRPRGFMIIDPVGSVNVRLTGSKKVIRQLNPQQVSISVDLTPRQEGSTIINLRPDDVLAPSGLDVVSIEPSTIRVQLEREVLVSLPVVPKLVGKPATGTAAGEPEVFPSQVRVLGPASVLNRIDSLSTPPIRLDGKNTTFEEVVPVLLPDPLIQVVQSSTVTVRIPIQPPPEDQTAEAKPRKENS